MNPPKAEHRPAKSGWCTAAAGAAVVHHACRWDLCACECHGSGTAACHTPEKGCER